MIYVLVIIIALVALFVLLQLSVIHQSKKQVGQTAPETTLTSGTDGTRPILLYFHSPHCGPCKAMSVIITELAETDTNVISVDISQDLESARAYNVRATPTVVQVKDGVITQVLVGPQSREKLENLLA